MRAIILNGSLKSQQHLKPIQDILEGELSTAGLDVQAVQLHEIDIKSCLGCFKCWDTTPGLCIQTKDKTTSVVEKIIQSELVVFLTPLTFGGYSSELKKIIERSLGLLQPGVKLVNGESHHLTRYDRYPLLLAIGISEKQDDEEEKIFKTLIYRHSLNFYPPKYRADVFHVGDTEREIRERTKVAIDDLELGQ